MKYDLAQLIESKDFNELNKEEQSFVLNQITESEYILRREVILKSKEIFKNDLQRIKPNKAIKAAALESLRNKKSKKKVIPFIGYKVPAWLAAASILLAFLLNSILNFSFNKTETSIHQLSQIDTVYVEKKIIDTVKIQEQPDTIIKVVYLPQKEKQSTTNSIQKNKSTPNNKGLQNLEHIPTNNYNTVIDLNTEKKHLGKSLNEDELAQSVLGI